MKNIEKQLRLMDNTEPVMLFHHSLKRHNASYPGGKSRFEFAFEKALNKTNISDKKLKAIAKELDAYNKFILNKVEDVRLKNLKVEKPVTQSFFTPVPRAMLKRTEDRYNLELVGIKSRRYADDHGSEYGPDREEPYIVWSCFGPDFRSSGVTEIGKDVKLNSEYLYREQTNVFSNQELTLPLFFLFQVCESDPGGPSNDDVAGVIEAAGMCISEIISKNYAAAIVSATKMVVGTISIITDLLAAGDDLYPIQVLQINKNVLDRHTTGQWDYHGQGGDGLFDGTSNMPFRILDNVYSESNKLQWQVVYFLYKTEPTLTPFISDGHKPIATFFMKNNYTGTKKQLTREGRFSDMKNIGNDKISSIAIRDGYEVLLYEHPNFRGKFITLTKNTPRLGDYSFNDRTSSFIVHKHIKDPIVRVYRHPRYRGEFEDFYTPGYVDITSLKKSNVGNDAISSIKIREGYKAVLYEHDKRRGKSLTLINNVSDLNKKHFNDKVSSIVIEKMTV